MNLQLLRSPASWDNGLPLPEYAASRLRDLVEQTGKAEESYSIPVEPCIERVVHRDMSSSRKEESGTLVAKHCKRVNARNAHCAACVRHFDVG